MTRVKVIVGKGRIEMPPPAVDALAHGATESRPRPAADPGRHVRGNVGGVDGSEGRGERQSHPRNGAPSRALWQTTHAPIPASASPLLEEGRVRIPSCRAARPAQAPGADWQTRWPTSTKQRGKSATRLRRPPRQNVGSPSRPHRRRLDRQPASPPGQEELEAQVFRRPELVRLGADRPVCTTSGNIRLSRAHGMPQSADRRGNPLTWAPG